MTGLYLNSVDDWISTSTVRNNETWFEMLSITEVKGKGIFCLS